MGIFRQFPYSNFHDLNTDWLINKVKDMLKEMFDGLAAVEQKVDDFVIETESIIKNEVNTWLDEHPEATTTVQDDSLTTAKYKNGSVTLEKLSPELQRDIPRADRFNMFFTPIDVTKVADLYRPEDHYAQGAACDGQGNFYVFWAPSKNTAAIPCIVKYNLNNLDIHSEMYFTDYPNVGHGNSIAYDNINSVIVILSSSGYITLVNTDLQVVNHYYTGASDSAGRFSQIAMNDDYLIINQTGTDNYYFYKRLSEKLFGMYAVGNYEMGRGMRDALQDAFIYQDSLISISSTSTYDVYLSVIGINTAYITTLRILGLEKEIEGAFSIGRDAYFIAADGSMYISRLPNFQVANAGTRNPAIIPNYSRHIPSSAYYASIASSVYQEMHNSENSPYNYNIARVVPDIDVPFYNKINYLPERSTVLGWNSFNVSCITNESLRIAANVRGVEVHVSYTKQSNNTQVLSSIQLIANNGQYRSVSFAADGSDFETKIASLFDTTQSVYLTIGDSTFSITLYGRNSTSDAILNFVGILTE